MVNTPTNFLNMKKRRIFQGERGGFFVRDADGKMHRGIKAAYRKVGANGNESKLGPKNRESVPVKLRRAVRKNAGVRKPKNENEGGIINGIVNALVGNAEKTRKTRKNKGAKRVPRKTKANRVPRRPAAPVIAMHPMNLPVRRPAAAAKANRVPRLPAAPVIAMHPVNLPVRSPAASVVAMNMPVRRPAAAAARRPAAAAAKANRVPRLPAAPVVKRHPMNRPRANNFLINNAMRNTGLSTPAARSPAFARNLANVV